MKITLPANIFELSKEFFRSFANPYTYHPRKNLYNIFGALWGLPIPLVTIGISLHFLHLPWTFASAGFVVESDPSQIFFLLHPVLFYLVFGTLGTMHKKRDEEILGGARKLEMARERLILEEKMATIGRLAAGVAHEINNPLSIIIAKIGYLKSLDAGSPEYAEQVRKDIDKFEKHLMRISGIANALLSFARQSSETKAAISFPKILDETLLFIQNELKRNNIELVKKFQTQSMAFEGSPGEFQQVFLNLISNAIDAMKEHGKGTLTVAYEEGKDVQRVKIEDTGVGIPEAVRPLVMEPFFTTKGLGKGTGLGLSISFGIVAKHGGVLSFSSKEGKGTTFSLTFPASGKTATNALYNGGNKSASDKWHDREYHAMV